MRNNLRFYLVAKSRPTVLCLCALSALTLAACNKSKPSAAAQASAGANAAAAVPTDQPATAAAAAAVTPAGAQAGAKPGGQAGPTPASDPNGKPVSGGAGPKMAAAEHVPGHARRIGGAKLAAAKHRVANRAPAGPRTYSAEYRTCLAGANSYTAARADCYSAELARQGARVSRAYESLLAARSGDARTEMQRTQAAWIQLRDSQCQEDPDAGARDILHEGSCRLDMTIRRAVELEHMAG
jgi:uncharacterized protein YecT (DUF1311 family)